MSVRAHLMDVLFGGREAAEAAVRLQSQDDREPAIHQADAWGVIAPLHGHLRHPGVSPAA
jgi:hypothetical protein